MQICEHAKFIASGVTRRKTWKANLISTSYFSYVSFSNQYHCHIKLQLVMEEKRNFKIPLQTFEMLFSSIEKCKWGGNVTTSLKLLPSSHFVAWRFLLQTRMGKIYSNIRTQQSNVKLFLSPSAMYFLFHARRKLIHSANPQSRPVVIIVFAQAMLSPLFKV